MYKFSKSEIKPTDGYEFNGFIYRTLKDAAYARMRTEIDALFPPKASGCFYLPFDYGILSHTIVDNIDEIVAIYRRYKQTINETV